MIKNPAKRELIKTLLKEVLYNSLAQAIIKTFSSRHKPLKVFLFIFILCSSVLASYLVIESIMSYFSYGVTTTTRTFFETPSLFPKVTICNLNPFTTEYSYSLTQKTQNNELNPNEFSMEEKKKIGHDIKDILVNCLFNNKKCKWTDFVWSFDPVYGNCYTFNTGFDSNGSKVDLKKSNVAGPFYGLQLEFYVNVFEPLFLKHTNLNGLNGLGALIRLGNSSYSTFYSRNGILVAPGFQTNIAVEREFKSMLPKPYSNCEIDSSSPKFMSDKEAYNLIRKSDYAYTQQFCYFQCYQNHIFEKYNCIDTYGFMSLLNGTQCDPYTTYLIQGSEDSFGSDLINKICFTACPLECNIALYKTSISSLQLNGNRYVTFIKQRPKLASDFINRTVDATMAKESFVHVNIFYENLSYVQIMESPQTNWVSLLSSIGGNLGLFLGVSLFSLCEIIEVAIETVYILKLK